VSNGVSQHSELLADIAHIPYTFHALAELFWRDAKEIQKQK
jgi:hypothetical protein